MCFLVWRLLIPWLLLIGDGALCCFTLVVSLMVAVVCTDFRLFSGFVIVASGFCGFGVLVYCSL